MIMIKEATEITQIEREFSSLEAEDRVRLIVERYRDQLVLSTSFGVQSAVLLHMATRVWPNVPVIFIDTGYLFPETYHFADALEQRLNLNLHVYQPEMTAGRQEALYGKRWEMGKEALEQYNLMNKVEPMNRALQDLGASVWMSGLRRSQSSTREALPMAHLQNKTIKFYPIIDWTDRDIYEYLTRFDLPYHPLWEKGYVSVGDWHSTSPLGAGMQAEETRFSGLKRECGLHEASGQVDYQI